MRNDFNFQWYLLDESVGLKSAQNSECKRNRLGLKLCPSHTHQSLKNFVLAEM